MFGLGILLILALLVITSFVALISNAWWSVKWDD